MKPLQRRMSMHSAAGSILLQPPLSDPEGCALSAPSHARQRNRQSARCVSLLLRSLLLVIFLMANMAGCASSHYERLVSERDIPELAALRAEGAAIPNHLALVPTQIGEGRVIDVALYDTGQPEADRAIVLIHGVLSDQTIWRFVRGGLGADHRLLLFDLPGAGRSDKPTAGEVGDDGYTPRMIAERLLQALRLHFDVTRRPLHITLVGHSFGGAVAMQMAGVETLQADYSDVVDRVDRLVLFTPADVEITTPPSLFEEIATTSEVEYWLAQNTGILRERVAEGIATMFCAPAPGLKEEADTLVTMLSDAKTRTAQVAILRQFVPTRENGRIDWSRVRAITRSYANIRAATLIVWGRYDETLPVAMGYKLAAEIPSAQLHIISSCMHSAPLEQPRETERIIREFSARGRWE